MTVKGKTASKVVLSKSKIQSKSNSQLRLSGTCLLTRCAQ